MFGDYSVKVQKKQRIWVLFQLNSSLISNQVNSPLFVAIVIFYRYKLSAEFDSMTFIAGNSKTNKTKF